VFFDENHDYNGYGYQDNCDDYYDYDYDDDDAKAITNAIKTNISSEDFSHTCNI